MLKRGLSSNGTESWDRGLSASRFSKSTDFEKAYLSDSYVQKIKDLLFSKTILELIFLKDTVVMTSRKTGGSFIYGFDAYSDIDK
jgi:hypothetical protein